VISKKRRYRAVSLMEFTMQQICHCLFGVAYFGGCSPGKEIHSLR
jgi:hypothetical protein